MRTILLIVFICSIVTAWAFPATESKPSPKNSTVSLPVDPKLNGTLLPEFNGTELIGADDAAGDREGRIFWPYWGPGFGAYPGYGYGFGPMYRGGYPGPGYFWG